MNISSVTEAAAAPAMPVPVVAPGTGAPAAGQQDEQQAAVSAPVASAPEPPPPPPPREGFNVDVEVGIYEETNTKVYNFVDPDSGSTIVQIPIEAVLDLVADILRHLEAEGKR